MWNSSENQCKWKHELYTGFRGGQASQMCQRNSVVNFHFPMIKRGILMDYVPSGWCHFSHYIDRRSLR